MSPAVVLESDRLEVLVRQLQPQYPGVLKRRCVTYCKEIVNLSYTIRQGRGGDNPTNPPAGNRESLAHAVDEHRTTAHSGKRNHRNVPMPVISDVLVDFVCNRERIELLAE